MKHKLLLTLLAVLAIAGGGYGAYVTRYQKPAQTVTVVAQKQPEAKPVDKYNDGPPDATEILELVNQERVQRGIAPMTMDVRLVKSAQTKADDMAKNNYFSHVDSTGKHGYSYIPENAPGLCYSDSENIGYGGNTITSRSTYYGWVGSKPHHDALINSTYSLTGIAVAYGNDKIYVVEHFCQLN